METKYLAALLEKERAEPYCFVSRNQKRPGRRFLCFLETKHAQNPGLFPMFPFSCVSTSTLIQAGLGKSVPTGYPYLRCIPQFTSPNMRGVEVVILLSLLGEIRCSYPTITKNAMLPLSLKTRSWLCISTLRVSLLIPAFRGLSQNGHQHAKQF